MRFILIDGSILDLLSRLCDLLLHALGRGRSLLRHVVSLDTLGLLAVCAGDVDVVGAIIPDEVGQVLDSPRARVFNRGVLSAGLEELDCREAGNLLWHIVHGCVDLGDRDLVAERLELGGQVVVLGRKSLAVTTPWRVELNQDILVVVHHDVLVVLGDHDRGRALLLLRDRLRLDGWLDLASHIFVNELANVLGRKLLLRALGRVRELLALLRVLNGKGGPVADLEVQVATVLAKGLGVDGREVDLALLLLSNGLESLRKLLALLRGLGEDVCERDASLQRKGQIEYTSGRVEL